MDIEAKDEKALRKYLLGDVLAKEEERIELWLMSDEKAYDFVAAAEDDLIDDFLMGNLKIHEIERFKQHFLAAPERQRKLQFSRSLKRFVEIPNPDMALAPKPVRLWPLLLDLFRYRPASGYAMTAAVAVLLLGFSWSFFRITELGRQLNSTVTQLSSVQREREEFRRQLGESQSLGDKLQSQLRTIEQASADRKTPSNLGVSLALILTPGISRGSSRMPTVKISPDVRLVKFSLVLLGDHYDNYRVTLLDDSGQELWTRYKLAASIIGQNESVIFTVPGELIPAGDFSLSLKGISDSRPPEDIDSYYFRAIKGESYENRRSHHQ